MATTDISRGVMYRTVSSSSGTSVTQVSTKQYRLITVKPDTTRRPKPVDLFLNGTERSVSTDETIEGYATWQSGNTLTTDAVGEYISGGGPLNKQFPNVSTLFGGRLRAKIKDQNLNLAQSCAEYRQTCSMFAGFARDIYSTFRSLRNGRAFADFVRMLQRPRNRHERDIANRWLEYQYGLKPLMSDIYNSAEFMKQRIKTGIPCFVRSSENGTFEDSELFGIGSPYSRSWQCDYQARAKARYIVRDAAIKELAQTGISNPLLLVWELIPYSFVVDWAFPVGNFLSSLDSLNGTSSLVWQYGIRTHYVCTYGYRGGRSTRERTVVFRSAPSSSLPLPSLGYKPSTSLTAVLNGLALLTQIRTGR